MSIGRTVEGVTCGMPVVGGTDRVGCGDMVVGGDGVVGADRAIEGRDDVVDGAGGGAVVGD